MTAGKKGTSNLSTLTRSVAGICRTEDDETVRAAVSVLLRAYDDADHAAGKLCLNTACRDCVRGMGPEPLERRALPAAAAEPIRSLM